MKYELEGARVNFLHPRGWGGGVYYFAHVKGSVIFFNESMTKF